MVEGRWVSVRYNTSSQRVAQGRSVYSEDDAGIGLAVGTG